MKGSRPIRRLSLILAPVTLLAPLLGGCVSAGSVRSGVSPTSVLHYRSGDYRAALLAAETTDGRGSPTQELIAGMSLAALDRNDEARARLEPLTRSPDPHIRGRANATIGLVLAEAGDHENASTLLASAADDLAGPLRGWAAFYAAESAKVTGNEDGIKRLERAAELRGPGYAGLGFFWAIHGATRLVRLTLACDVPRKSDEAAAETAGLDEPRIEPIVAGEQTLYAVRVGRFETQPAARTASGAVRRRCLRRPNLTLTPDSPGDSLEPIAGPSV